MDLFDSENRQIINGDTILYDDKEWIAIIDEKTGSGAYAHPAGSNPTPEDIDLVSIADQCKIINR